MFLSPKFQDQEVGEPVFLSVNFTDKGTFPEMKLLVKFATGFVAFTDKSTGTPTTWKWSFGDGTNSTIQNPAHNYSKVGNYTVALTVSNAVGNNTMTKSSYITVK